MNNIFWGFFFVTLDFSLNLGNISIGLIPSFIGFWLLGKGLTELEKESTLFQKMIPWTKGMMIFTAIIYACDLFGVWVFLGGIGTFIGIIASILNLYVTYQIVMGFKELEDYHQANIGAEKLRSAWMAKVIATLVTILIVFIPLINIIALIVAFVLNILFLVAVYNSKKAYLELPPIQSITDEEQNY